MREAGCDRRPGAGLHPGRRHRLRRGGRRAGARRRRLRRPAVVLLRRLERAVRGGRQVPGRAPDVGHDHARALRRDGPAVACCAASTSRPPGQSLTAQSIDNNVVRTTVQALAAVLGGAQSLHTNSRDEALALPTEEAARLALRTQQILAYEAGVTETPDPLAGLVLRREPDQRARGGRLGLPRRDRGAGRHARRHRAGLPAARDPGGGLPRPAGGRQRRPDRRGRQPVPRRRGHARRRPTASTRTGSAARSSGSGGSAPSARPRRGRRPWTSSSAVARADGNLMPADPRRRPGPRHRRRDQRPAAGRLGRAPRAHHGLTAPAGGTNMSAGQPLPARIRSLGKIHHVALIVALDRRGLGLWRDMLGLELETIMDIESGPRARSRSCGRRVEDRARPADRRHDRRGALPRRRGRASTTSASRSPT